MTQKSQSALRHFLDLFSFTSFPASWREYFDLIRSQRFQPYFIVAFTLWLVGAVEIVQKTTGQRLDPRFWMLVAIVITAYSGVRIFRLSPSVPTVNRSNRSGAVDKLMSRLVSNGFAVYCEPSTAKGSEAYVLVGPSGVYTTEIKSRDVFGSGTIEFRDNNELVFGGRISDRRPMQYAEAAAGKLRDRFTGVSQVQAVIKPLVVFLNDWQINQPDTGQDVSVLTANQLESYLNAQPSIFTKAQVAEISSYLD